MRLISIAGCFIVYTQDHFSNEIYRYATSVNTFLLFIPFSECIIPCRLAVAAFCDDTLSHPPDTRVTLHGFCFCLLPVLLCKWHSEDFAVLNLKLDVLCSKSSRRNCRRNYWRKRSPRHYSSRRTCPSRARVHVT